MLRSRRTSLASIALVGVVLLPAAAWAQAKVAVIDTVQASLKLKLGVRESVAAALDDLSVVMVPLEDMLPEDASCTDQACYATVAKRIEATHLLLVQGVANPAGYRLTLEVRDGETGRTLGTDGKDCELCAESQLAPTVKEKVTALWVRVMQEQSAAAAAAAAPQPPPEDKTPLGVTTESPEKAESTPWWKQRTPGLGLGFAGLGLLGLGFGIYYVAVDGNAVEKNVSGDGVMLRDTAKWGWSLVGVGAVSLLAGSAMIIWGRDDGTEVSVAVGPNSVGLQGRF
jgi:hypothetical protein